jgi:6,7-dimethyl-8-ribityllumazine synthase
MAGRAPVPPRTGSPAPEGQAFSFAIVAARFNEPITKRLVDGALAALSSHGPQAGAVEVYWVPGSFELPQAAAHLAATGRYAAIVCLGVVIRGQTPHFEHVAREAAAGIREVGLRTGVPVTFGVITALTEDQAWDRAGGAVGNRGEEAAEAAFEMAQFVRAVRGGSGRGRRSRSGGGRSTRRSKSPAQDR